MNFEYQYNAFVANPVRNTFFTFIAASTAFITVASSAQVILPNGTTLARCAAICAVHVAAADGDSNLEQLQIQRAFRLQHSGAGHDAWRFYSNDP